MISSKKGYNNNGKPWESSMILCGNHENVSQFFHVFSAFCSLMSFFSCFEFFSFLHVLILIFLIFSFFYFFLIFLFFFLFFFLCFSVSFFILSFFLWICSSLFFFLSSHIFPFLFFLWKKASSFFSCISFLKYVSLLALVSEFNCWCFLRSRCPTEMWCPDDTGRASCDWVGPPTWERAWFNSPEWGGGASPVKTGPPQIGLLLLLCGGGFCFCFRCKCARGCATHNVMQVLYNNCEINWQTLRKQRPNTWDHSRCRHRRDLSSLMESEKMRTHGEKPVSQHPQPSMTKNCWWSWAHQTHWKRHASWSLPWFPPWSASERQHTYHVLWHWHTTIRSPMQLNPHLWDVLRDFQKRCWTLSQKRPWRKPPQEPPRYRRYAPQRSRSSPGRRPWRPPQWWAMY